MQSFSPTASALLVPLILSTIAASVCYFTTGPSLNFLIGPLLLAPLLVPPLAGLSPRLTPLAVALPVSVLWLVLERNISLSSWFFATLILLTFTAMLAAGTYFLKRLRLPDSVASAIITLLAYAWLAAPICFPRAIVPLIPVHPIFAMNTISTPLGIWTEQRVIYRLTTLGQDVPYELPPTALPCIMAQAALTIAFLAMTIPMSRSPQHDNDQN